MINGTDSHDHMFDGRMYGLKTQYTDVGLAIKNHGELFRGGYHSMIFIRSVMAHIHMDKVRVEKQE